LPLLVSALCACGYQLAKPGEGKPEAYRVGAFQNYTAQVEAGGLFGGALRDELAARGRLAPEGGAGPELAGELLALRSTPSALGGQGAAAFRLEADVRLRLRDSSGVVYEDQATLAEDYLAGVDVLGTEANRRAALRRLARSLSRELVERMEVGARF